MAKVIEIVKKHKFKIIISILMILVLFAIYSILVPRLKVNGNKNVRIKLNEKYIEKGATATLFGKDVSRKVNLISNVNSKKVGKYKVEYTIKNGIITIKDYRIVNVIDDINPVIELKGDLKKTICPSTKYEEEGYTAIDNYDGDITKKVEVDIKDTLISYKVKDSSGNETIATREIVRRDEEKPKIELKGSSIVYLPLGSNYVESGVSVTDNCDSNLNDKVIITGAVDKNKSGSYSINYEVADNNGNKNSINRTVIVYDRTSSVPGSTNNGKIYLTFDDGPSSTITPGILKILKEKNVKATFFVINAADSLNYLIKQAYNDGHTIGLHSYTHKYDVIYQSPTAYFEDLNKISNKVYSVIGSYSKIIRFPGGSSNTISAKYSVGIMSYLSNEVINRGYHYFDWNVSCEDAGSARTKEDVYRNVVNNLSKSRMNVVLLHDFENNYKTLNALSDIIDYGINNGYIFESISFDTPLVTHGVNN